MNKRIRLGMVGGGQGGFIGGVHRIAARLDDRYELVAGSFSSDAERGKISAEELHVAPERAYASFAEMAEKEAAREDGIEAVAIVTPNHLHYAPSLAFLKAGIHVICDKPVTTTLQEAKALRKAIADSGKLFVLTHNYTGYPMVRQMRAMVREGVLGTLRHMQVEYAQDWLSQAVEKQGAKGAEWRTDPARAGGGGAIGDIGTHAYNIASFVTGETPSHLLADLTSYVEGRVLDDSANILLRYQSGAKGMLWATQIAVGNENHLALRIYGDKGGLEWNHERVNELRYTPYGQPMQTLTRNGAGALSASNRVARVPSGHPEGYLEGFATIYREAADAIVAARNGQKPDAAVTYPTIQDGIDGLAFIEAAIRSNKAGAAWTTIER